MAPSRDHLIRKSQGESLFFGSPTQAPSLFTEVGAAVYSPLDIQAHKTPGISLCAG